VADDPARIAALAEGKAKPRARVCWFSDGGVSSNFPVHFFDASLPRHPTFAINLRPFHPEHPKSPDERENVWMVTSHQVVPDWWYAPDASLPSFLYGLVRTMQNRVDELQMRMPGHRDRVVHVSMTDEEGGLNLTMPPEVIEALTERGKYAGELLVERFTQPPANPDALSWDDHRWVRYRSFLGALATMLRQFARGYGYSDATQPSYRALLRRGSKAYPNSYRVTRAQRELAERLSDELAAMALGMPADAPEELLERDAPRPLPAMRLVPQDPPATRRDP
jgi:hypothetical protein